MKICKEIKLPYYQDIAYYFRSIALLEKFIREYGNELKDTDSMRGVWYEGQGYIFREERCCDSKLTWFYTPIDDFRKWGYKIVNYH